ncbi:MAG: hypothetical protein H6573_22905 [Lewinellaceae bacterium]|nr:hypothetical protein [Phaeodactylibacter sp.]MCB0615836.1 hypothetical protein [Phaeodactylibacter sp.]MCB9350338.1 hypothetical protein [Lewinellaceae bacterium]
MGMLQVVIGLVFVLLLLSLLATTVMELLASFMALRGKNLEKALRNMLANTDVDEKLLAAFKDNSLYKQLGSKYGKSHRSPSYIKDETFQSILMDIVLKGEGIDKLEAKIDELPDEDLKNVLKQFLREADGKTDLFKEKVQGWYNDVMDRASGWYKRYTQKILVGVGFLIAILFNADTLAIYERLESDPDTLQKVVNLAEDFAGNENALAETAPAGQDFQSSLSNLKGLVDNQIESVRSPLGLGWKNVVWEEVGWYDVVTKVLGWIVTALAVSMGAPFWFDLLRKMVNIRTSGNKPGE